MITLSGAVLILADLWGDDLIVPDIWSPSGDIPTPEAVGVLYSEYYLKQMNYLGY